MKKITFVFFITAVGLILTLGIRQNDPAGETSRQTEQSVAGDELMERPPAEQARAERVMKALASAYPRQIEKVELRDGDWAVLLRDTWYYYAGGRLLPEELLESAGDFNPSPFYNYSAEMPSWRSPTPEEAERYRSMSNNRRQNSSRRSPHFFDDLWRARNRGESYERVKTLRFLGHTVTVHHLILESLSLIEEEILAASKEDPQIRSWVNNIKSLEGWAWRNIAETQSRSYHAYGLAVDILPKSYGGKETYWLWASNKNVEWWNISYNNRYSPPDTVIKIFEKYGFVWGGKWLYFDTMHFEYRPEILILSGIPVETRR